jgi:hypothetical protein
MRIDRRGFVKAGGALAASAVLPDVAMSANQGGGNASAAVPAASPVLAPRFGDARDWWFQHRFGLFVHWGLYAINGFHEQEQWRRRVPRDAYATLAERWNPVRFDPDEWLDLVQAAGMGYVCVTAKHHDGFCLWNTKATRFNTMNTPYGRDVVGMLSAACHRRRVPLCLYYSIVDWKRGDRPRHFTCRGIETRSSMGGCSPAGRVRPGARQSTPEAVHVRTVVAG